MGDRPLKTNHKYNELHVTVDFLHFNTFTVLVWTWCTHICRWCLRTIWNIFMVLIVMTRNTRNITTIKITSHALLIQNLTMTNAMGKIHKTEVAFQVRGTVTSVLYCKWRIRQRTLSTDTAAKLSKEIPDVIQPDTKWSIFNVKNALKFCPSSAILWAAEIAWHIKPTKRSVVDKQPKRMKEGEWRSSLFAIANTIRKFPAHVSPENKTSKEQVSTLVTKSSLRSWRESG